MSHIIYLACVILALLLFSKISSKEEIRKAKLNNLDSKSLMCKKEVPSQS